MAEKKYYWLKLKRDFFKRHDIRIIESMPNGKDYILFYLKLLLESIDHEGALRFSDAIPYNEQMLSVITNTNVDIVKSAMEIFLGLNMIEVFDDRTIYMNEVDKLIGSESASAERVRKHRESSKLLQCNADVTKCNIEIDKDIYTDTDIEKEEEKESSPPAQPSDTVSDSASKEFEELWSRYPRKEGTKAAFASYQRAKKKGVTFEDVKAGILNYLDYIKAKKIEAQFIKQGSTWFNGEHWNDEYDYSVSETTSQPTNNNPFLDMLKNGE